MNYSKRQITKQLGRRQSMSSRELKRNTQKKYQAKLTDE